MKVKKILLYIFCGLFIAGSAWSAQVVVGSGDTRQEAWAKETLNNSDLQTNINVSVQALNPASTYTIGTSGCDYTTIQAALDANTDPNTMFVVYPGTYAGDTINFTANNQYVVGAHNVAPKVALLTGTATIIDIGAFTGGIIKDIKAVMTVAANGSDTLAEGTGSVGFKFCHLEAIGSGTVPDAGVIVMSGAGDFKMVEGSIVLTDNSVRGVKGKKAVLVATGSTMIFDDVTFTVTGTNSSSSMSAVRSNLVGYVTVDKCDIDVTDNASDKTYAVSIINGTGTAEMAFNTVHVNNSTNDAVGMYAAGGAAGLYVRSMYNHVHVVAGSGTANFVLLANSDTTIISQFDDVIAADGVSNTGGSYTYVNSLDDGDLNISGTVIAGALTVESNIIDFGDVTDNYVLTFDSGSNTWAGELGGVGEGDFIV